MDSEVRFYAMSLRSQARRNSGWLEVKTRGRVRTPRGIRHAWCPRWSAVRSRMGDHAVDDDRCAVVNRSSSPTYSSHRGPRSCGGHRDRRTERPPQRNSSSRRIPPRRCIHRRRRSSCSPRFLLRCSEARCTRSAAPPGSRRPGSRYPLSCPSRWRPWTPSRCHHTRGRGDTRSWGDRRPHQRRAERATAWFRLDVL